MQTETTRSQLYFCVKMMCHIKSKSVPNQPLPLLNILSSFVFLNTMNRDLTCELNNP